MVTAVGDKSVKSEGHTSQRGFNPSLPPLPPSPRGSALVLSVPLFIPALRASPLGAARLGGSSPTILALPLSHSVNQLKLSLVCINFNTHSPFGYKHPTMDTMGYNVSSLVLETMETFLPSRATAMTALSLLC